MFTDGAGLIIERITVVWPKAASKPQESLDDVAPCSRCDLAL